MISFAVPWALVGLVAAGLPLLLHLVRRHEAPEVVFPAVRYLHDATRDRHRRLKFRHWLLLILRTLLIIALVLAAAGASFRQTTIGPHAPSALVVVIDNAAASGAIIDGEPLLASLLRAAQQVLDRATLNDRVWVIAADGIARAGTAAELKQSVVKLKPSVERLDLGRAVNAATALLRGTNRLGHIVVISAMQRTALTAVLPRLPNAARLDPDILVLRPTSPPPANRALMTLTAASQPWSPAGGRITISIASSDTSPVPVTVSVGARAIRDVLITPGTPSVQRIGPQGPGWIVVTASLPPDELRIDDARSIAVRVAPPAAVQWDPADRYIAAAAAVLAADGRIRPGSTVHLGTLAPGVSIVMPPEDPAHVGAVNRALAVRGIPWQFGSPVATSERTDSGAVLPARETILRRYTLDPNGAPGDVLATVGGAPWLVRSGDVLLLGSRLDPGWTGLPVSASFVPFLDAVLTSAARGELVSAEAVAGEPIRLPARVTAVVHDGVATAVSDPGWTPRATGVFHLLAGTDTLGAISVRLDARQSDLTRATDRDVRTLWQGATLAGLRDGPALAFAAGGRGDLRGALLLLALCCALAETVLTGRVRKRT